MRTKSRLLILFALPLGLIVAGCGGPRRPSGGDAEGNETVISEEAAELPEDLQAFPEVTVPLVYADDGDAASEYVMEHFWDTFLASDGSTTAFSVLGVADGEVEQALASYITILEARKALATPDEPAPYEQACASVRNFFRKLEKKQLADTSSLAYLRLTEMVSRYLYDPNSPYRDEDLYLPFVELMEKSACTSDDMRTACKFEASQCRTNSFGKKVPDIRYSDASGRKGTLYGVNADYTMLFFSNPGCNSCKEIIDDIRTRRYVEDYIKTGRLAIVNIYIDEEISKWRDYLPNYPGSWINGYDYTFKLRESGAFDIRAIPSLYLLDSRKRVLMKDAPTEKVLSFLDQI